MEEMFVKRKNSKAYSGVSKLSPFLRHHLKLGFIGIGCQKNKRLTGDRVIRNRGRGPFPLPLFVKKKAFLILMIHLWNLLPHFWLDFWSKSVWKRVVFNQFRRSKLKNFPVGANHGCASLVNTLRTESFTGRKFREKRAKSWKFLPLK